MRSILKSAMLIILVVSLTFCQELSDEELEKKMFLKFQKFIEKYKKNYGSQEEFKSRYEIFKSNYKKAKEILKNDPSEAKEYSMGVTPLMDLTEDEFKTLFLIKDFDTSILPTDATPYDFGKGSQTEPNQENKSENGFLNNEGRNLQTAPVNWDWRSSNLVTDVKNQGSCGGCWAFSAAANIEGQYAKKYKQLVSFSAQQMIDCDYSNYGCNGGLMHNAFTYIKNNGGLATWTSYPYLGYRGYCRYATKVARVSGYISAGTTNEEAIKTMLYQVGPLSIAVNASTLQYYKGGIYDVPYSYCPNQLDHGVTLVGYGVSSTGIPYWIIKNSWGPYWGESGYYRIRRGTGLCGVNQYVYSAVLA